MADTDLDERVRELHAHLEATEELPIDPRTNRWIGEAQAVTADVVDADLPEAVVRERIGEVERLLAHVDDLDGEAADRIESARTIAREIASGSDGP